MTRASLPVPLALLASARPVCYLRCVIHRALCPRSASRSLPKRRAAGIVVALALFACLASTPTRADADDTAPRADVVAPAPIAPPGPPGAGGDATKLIKDVEASATSPRTAKVVAEPLKQAKTALERAHGARMSGDLAHGKMLDGLALEWAETARDLLRAVAAEDAALAAGQKAREVEIKVERARALLEETQARHGRATADLARIEADAAEAAKKAAAAEEERIDAAGKKPAPTKGQAAPKKGGASPKADGAKKAGASAPGKKGAAAPRRSP